MANFSFKDYGPTITNDSVANDIYNKIIRLNPKDTIVTLDLDGVYTMTTKCAKIIFGGLYKALSADLYYRNIQTKNCSETLSMIIDLAIEYTYKS